MPGTRRSHRSRRKNSMRWMILAIILCSGMSCLAPVLYASTDCSRWLAEYKQGILQRRAARRLRAAKYRLTAIVHKPAPAHHYPTRRRMSPLESLRQFQIDCGDLENPGNPVANAPVITPLPVQPQLAMVSFPELPPELPPPTAPEPGVAPDVPPLINVPTTPVEIGSVLPPGEVPEPGSFLLVLTGAAAAFELTRRKSRARLLTASAI